MTIENRSDVIKTLIANNGYTRYLEIGVRDNRNFNRINTPHKDGVDPAGRCNYVMTSDEFFNKIPKDQMYDIVFIDGLHLRDQALRDVNNSLEHLLPGGAIVMHDCSPIKPEHATEVYKGGTWNGTVYQAFAELRMTRPDLSMWTVDEDCGCGIIKRGQQELFPKSTVNFDLLNKNRKKLLNLISVEQFLSLEI
jgi:hypothetical protein